MKQIAKILAIQILVALGGMCLVVAIIYGSVIFIAASGMIIEHAFAIACHDIGVNWCD